jgi:hypothetical protein
MLRSAINAGRFELRNIVYDFIFECLTRMFELKKLTEFEPTTSCVHHFIKIFDNFEISVYDPFVMYSLKIDIII